MKSSLKIFFYHIYNSPTYTTWISNLSRTLSLVLVLPLVLRNFSPEEISLWYLFSTMVALQSLVDLGFAPTFTRSIGNAMGGATEIQDMRNLSIITSIGVPNWDLVDKLWATMQAVYFRLCAVYVVLLITFGSLIFLKPISLLKDQSAGWISWGIIICASAVTFWNAAYSSYLQGVNEIPLLRRAESFINILAIISNFIVLLSGGGLLVLIISWQCWALVNTWWFHRLAVNAVDKKFLTFKAKGIDKEIFQNVWPSAWRSGLGIGMSYGLIQMTGIYYAQVANAKDVASYLFSLRIAQLINNFSQAPFYTKIPLLARLRSEGKIKEVISVAQHGMFKSYLVFVVGFCGVGVFAHPLLVMMKSNINFVDLSLWILLGWAFLFERYGAMHLQLYSISYVSIWDVANGIAGIIVIVVILLGIKQVGVYIFPLAFLAGNILFYSWYSAKHSYREYKLSFWSFESKTAGMAFMLMALFLIFAVLTD